MFFISQVTGPTIATSTDMEGYVTFVPTSEEDRIVQDPTQKQLPLDKPPSGGPLSPKITQLREPAVEPPKNPGPTHNAEYLRRPTTLGKASPLTQIRRTTYEPSSAPHGGAFQYGATSTCFHDDFKALNLTTPTPLLNVPTGSGQWAKVEGKSQIVSPKSATVGRAAGTVLLNQMTWSDSKVAPPLPPRSSLAQHKGDPNLTRSSRSNVGLDRGDCADGGVPKKPLPPPPPFVAASPICTLDEIVRYYSQSFPIDVRVHSGIGISKRTPDLEYLRLHDLTQSRVLEAVSPGGRSFNIPVVTDTRLALLHNPHADTQAAVQGYEYEGVAPLLALVPRPKLLAVTRAWSNPKVVLTEGEIVAPCGGSSHDEEGASIRVYSVTMKVYKVLPPSCLASFTTKALALCLPISDIVGYVPHPFPSQACILKWDNGPKCYPANVVLIKGVGIAPVLRCTSAGPVVAGGGDHDDGSCNLSDGDGNNTCRSPGVFHIPVDLPGLKVVVVERVESGDPAGGENATKHEDRTGDSSEWSGDLEVQSKINDNTVRF